MRDAPLTFDTQHDGLLLCPLCGHNCTHVDEVHVGGRTREDGDWVPVKVDARGSVTQNAIGLARPARGGDRRHFLTLVGWCEDCRDRFGIAFNQHKGSTYVSVVKEGWQPTEPDD